MREIKFDIFQFLEFTKNYVSLNKWIFLIKLIYTEILNEFFTMHAKLRYE